MRRSERALMSTGGEYPNPKQRSKIQGWIFYKDEEVVRMAVGCIAYA